MRDEQSRSSSQAKHLRKNLTLAETRLWARLRRNSIYGWRFRRQHPIGPYIADFACVEPRIIVEVDGDTHCSEEAQAHDARRESYLKRKGWRILRVTNMDVRENMAGVLEAIGEMMPPPPSGPPPHAGEGT